ncbi:AraC family transcriptional regulator [Parablautia muri]|uniref:AraC family transcriptional regulator n=1 Tax=Parablautia muri TaxID=2320879 RepID=A0A9X5GTI0_9FIRM|nr:AraC family transcriptional regulator [Parablautia muri]NBJ94224.1 AraC family transcriptional regulator [Parablautia muri]
MKNHVVNEKELRYIEFLNREMDKRHHTSLEDNLQYDLLRAGDPRAVEESEKILYSGLQGHLSDDPVRNARYIFVCGATLASRTAISGGMPSERAFNISDLYIQKMDKLNTVKEIQKLQVDMFSLYTHEMAELDKKSVFSKPITLCMDYIYHHLHESIPVQELASVANLNASYLSTLFKKETGITISDYILSKKIEAVGNMLKYSDYTYAEISSFLNFSSQSHFIRAFKKKKGITPKQYREKYYEIFVDEYGNRKGIPPSTLL